MNGVMIGEKHSYNDFGLILSSKVISPPEPKLYEVEVPLYDGSIDLTQAVTDEVKYKNRKITLNFSVIDHRSTWLEKISAIQNYLQGQRLKIIFDEDPYFYYIGRVSVDDWKTNKNIGSLVIVATVEPYKYSVNSSAVDWEWDIFDFEQGIINETGELIVSGERSITLICSKKRMFPTFTASNAMTVTFDGETYNLKAGSQKIYDIFFVEGKNEMIFKGNGTVTIDYTWGSL